MPSTRGPHAILASRQGKQVERDTLPEPCRTKQHSDSEWMAMYPLVERLYVLERRKLRDVMAYLEREYNFKATTQMYKKRFAKWGFSKNTVHASTNNTDSTPARRCETSRKNMSHDSSMSKRAHSKRQVRSKQSKQSVLAMPPRAQSSDAVSLLFMTKVRDWSMAHFDAASQPQNLTKMISGLARDRKSGCNISETINCSIKLVADLFTRGYGTLAGKLTRKTFLMIDDLVLLDGPVFLWNALEIMYNIVSLRQFRIFELFLNHLTGLAAVRFPKSHPLVQILLSLRSSLISNETLPVVLEQASAMNGDILQTNFGASTVAIYHHLLWDTRSISFPLSVMAGASKWLCLLEVNQTDGDNYVARWKEPPGPCGVQERRNVASIRQMCGMELDDPIIAIQVLPALLKCKLNEQLKETPADEVRRLHAQIAAFSVKIAVRMEVDSEAWDAAAKSMLNVLKLREFAHGEAHPQVLREIFFLEDVFLRAGKPAEASRWRKVGIQRTEKYVEEIE